MVNEIGKLLQKAFHWRAFENVTTEECQLRLKALGLNIYHQKLTKIFKNPFYCGLIVHTALEGKVIEGIQEKLISREIFLKVNDLLNEHNHGYSLNRENEKAPLKNFIKCEHCSRNMAGYIVKRKNFGITNAGQ